MRDLDGKVAVVTGAASGIGLALAAELGMAGMRVVLADIEAGPVESAAASLRNEGLQARARATDVADPDSVEDLASFTVDSFGRVDVVCNNAGVNRFGPVAEMSLADWRWILGVNLWGVINGVRAFLPHLRAQGAGHIVNTASMAAFMPLENNTPYTASKFAVVGLSDSLRAELQREGGSIGVTVVCPGMVATGIADAELHRTDGVPPSDDELTRRFRTRLRTDGISPESVAQTVVAAIREDREYVFTHPETVGPALAARSALIQRGLGPDGPQG